MQEKDKCAKSNDVRTQYGHSKNCIMFVLLSRLSYFMGVSNMFSTLPLC